MRAKYKIFVRNLLSSLFINIISTIFIVNTSKALSTVVLENDRNKIKIINFSIK